MVGSKIGPIVGMIGSILVMIFAFILLAERNWAVVIAGLQWVYLRLVFMLGIGAAGLVGGFFAFRKDRLLNTIPLVAAIVAIVGASIPVGALAVFHQSEFYYLPMYLYSSFFIELFLMILGFALTILNIYTDRRLLRKGEEEAEHKEVRKKVGKIIVQFIEQNKGKAFSAQSLYNRCVENTSFTILVPEIDELCYMLHNLGKFDLDIKENVNYYFSY